MFSLGVYPVRTLRATLPWKSPSHCRESPTNVVFEKYIPESWIHFSMKHRCSNLSCFLVVLVLGLFLFIPTTFPGLASAFSLIEPANNSTHYSGEQVRVQVDIGEVGGVIGVQYFWYAAQEDMLEELVDQKLALTASPNNVPPFGGTLRIPREAIGTYRLLAVAKLEEGQVDTEKWAVFDEILLHIKPKAKLIGIDFECEKPLRFGSAASAQVYNQVDFLGKRFALPVVGQFADGTIRSIRTQDTGTTYEVDDKGVVSVNSNGVLRLIGNGRTILHVNNRNQHAELEIQVKVKNQKNDPPVSNAGPNQTVYAGEAVILNGLASYDPEGGSLQYHWSQVRGSKISLLDPNSAKARFLAPFVPEDRLFRFKLLVTDIQGADSDPAYVDILVTP